MESRLIFLIAATFITFTYAAVPFATEPKRENKYVYVQASGSGARVISRKDKEAPFETAHKLPPYVTHRLNQDESLSSETSTKQKREAVAAKKQATPTPAPAPPPAGAIKLDPKMLIQKYISEIKPISSTSAPKATAKTASKKRTKKDASPDHPATSPRPILTSGAPPTPRSLNIEDPELVGSGSEKQRSRIQIKKGPNGQEYEYEYVYYYYDDDDNKETTEKVSNSHDGPARNTLTSNNEEKTHYSKEAATNEVIPNGRGRTRGRHLEDEDTVGEDRLPVSTRFPPRSRNLATTATPDEEGKKNRGRGKGSTTSSSVEADNASEESQGSRGRTRANVRRPSLDLVDSASFNTHSGTAGAEPPSGGPTFPSDLPPGPVRFLGATPNERTDDEESIEDKTAEVGQSLSTEDSNEDDSTVSTSAEATTTFSPMNKVALDLYAILQGTQKLSGDEDLNDGTATTNEPDITTIDDETTLAPTTEYTTPSTTTTTTTTTPAPTTTTTEAPAFGRNGFRRGSANRKKHGTTTTTPSSSTEASTDTKPKTRFGRPSFSRPRPGARTTAEPTHEQDVKKEESKPVSRPRPTHKSRFGGSRVRTSTTEAPAEQEEQNSSTAKPSFSRPRPGFNTRHRGRTTTVASTEGESSTEESAAPSSTTVRSRLRPAAGGSNVRPLRPGPRLNLARGRPGASTTTTAPEEDTDKETNLSEEPKEAQDSSSTAPAVEDKNPLTKLRNRQRLATSGSSASPATKPKAAASAPVHVRRVNPLLNRRKPGATTEPSTTEASQESESTEADDDTSDETEATVVSSSTTEEPRGLNKLLAGRRRLATRQPLGHK